MLLNAFEVGYAARLSAVDWTTLVAPLARGSLGNFVRVCPFDKWNKDIIIIQGKRRGNVPGGFLAIPLSFISLFSFIYASLAFDD
jgi:hypothetical protein